MKIYLHYTENIDVNMDKQYLYLHYTILKEKSLNQNFMEKDEITETIYYPIDRGAEFLFIWREYWKKLYPIISNAHPNYDFHQKAKIINKLYKIEIMDIYNLMYISLPMYLGFRINLLLRLSYIPYEYIGNMTDLEIEEKVTKEEKKPSTYYALDLKNLVYTDKKTK